MTELICIVCPKGCHLNVDEKNDLAVSGNLCRRGEEYGKKEMLNPTRIITSTVCIDGAVLRRCPVKTDKAIPKGLIMGAMKELEDVRIQAPVHTGQIIIPNVCGTGSNFVATRNLL